MIRRSMIDFRRRYEFSSSFIADLKRPTAPGFREKRNCTGTRRDEWQSVVRAPERDDAIAPRAAHFRRSCASRSRRFRRSSQAFLDEGGAAAVAAALAIEADDRRKRGFAGARRPCALAVALGDLSGELSLEQAYQLAVRFRRQAIDQALAAARGASSGRRAGRIRRHRHGQARQPRTQLFVRRRSAVAVRSGPLPRRERDDPGEAAVRIGRRMIELLQKRTADGYVVAGRPAASAVARSHADRAPDPRGHLPLRIERSAVGAGGIHSRACRGRRHGAGRAFPRRNPAVRLAAVARFRRDRRDSRDLARGSATISRRARAWARASI